MQLNNFVFAILTFFGPFLTYALDLDSIFDEVSTIDHDFSDIFRVVSQQVFRKADTQPIKASKPALSEVRKFVNSATKALNAASDKIGSDSTVEDSPDLVAAFCDDMKVFTNTQLKAADILVFKANNMRDAINGAQLPDYVVKLSSAFDRYADNMLPLTEHCTRTHMENIYVVKSTLHRALVDLKRSNAPR